MTDTLQIQHVTKQFGGLTAVDKVDINVRKNSISSIIGPNGAGKTTLFNCISGYYCPEEGKILFDGQPIQGLATYEIANLGIARTYQNIRLFKQLTALENILVGAQPHLTSGWFSAVIRSRKFKTGGVRCTQRIHATFGSCWIERIRRYLGSKPALWRATPAWKLPARWQTAPTCSFWMSPPLG